VREPKFHTVIERDEDGVFVATVSELPGCHTQARTREELTSRIREAIRVYRNEAGESVLRPNHSRNSRKRLVRAHEPSTRASRSHQHDRVR